MELVPKAPLQTQEILGTPECRWANNWAIRFFLASGAPCCSSYRRWTLAGAELLRAFGGYWAQLLLWLGVRPIHQRLGLGGWYPIIGQFPGTLILEHRGLHGQEAPCSIFFFFSAATIYSQSSYMLGSPPWPLMQEVTRVTLLPLEWDFSKAH